MNGTSSYADHLENLNFQEVDNILSQGTISRMDSLPDLVEFKVEENVQGGGDAKGGKP